MYSKNSQLCVEMLSKVILGAEKNQQGRGFAWKGNDNKKSVETLPLGWDIRQNSDGPENENIKIALAGSVYSASKMLKSS